jgi:hypothetical protein
MQNLTNPGMTMQQNYIEDCQVCCRPNILYIRIDEDTLDIEIDTEYDG